MTGIRLDHIKETLQYLQDGMERKSFCILALSVQLFMYGLMSSLSDTARTVKSLLNSILPNILRRAITHYQLKFTGGATAVILRIRTSGRLSGIQRSVFLHARPKTFISDFFAVGDLENNYNDGLLKLDVSLKTTDPEAKDFIIEAALFEDDQKDLC